jgi:hypothetical protein
MKNMKLIDIEYLGRYLVIEKNIFDIKIPKQNKLHDG